VGGRRKRVAIGLQIDILLGWANRGKHPNQKQCRDTFQREATRVPHRIERHVFAA
jgi:hypothetical protein